MGVDALAEAFDIDGVDEEFVAVVGEHAEGLHVAAEVGEFLPAVGDDEEVFVALAAGEVEDQALAADGGDEFAEPGPIETAFAEDPGGDDEVAGAGVEPLFGIGNIDSAADLEAAGPRGKGFAGGGVVAGAEHDHVAAAEVVLAVEFGEPGGGAFGNEVRVEARAGVGESAADDLFDASFVKIDAGPKHVESCSPTWSVWEMISAPWPMCFLPLLFHFGKS